MTLSKNSKALSWIGDRSQLGEYLPVWQSVDKQCAYPSCCFACWEWCIVSNCYEHRKLWFWFKLPALTTWQPIVVTDPINQVPLLQLSGVNGLNHRPCNHVCYHWFVKIRFGRGYTDCTTTLNKTRTSAKALQSLMDFVAFDVCYLVFGDLQSLRKHAKGAGSRKSIEHNWI